MKYYPLQAAGFLLETMILANGSFPKHPVLLEWLTKCDYIVCCDGAVDDFLQLGRKPAAIVGDCDSLSAATKSLYADILYPDSDQETNDLTKSVRYCMSRGRSNIKIVGATGKREDHTLGNISLLSDYYNEVQVEMVTDYGVFTPINEASTFESFAGQHVSLFSMDASPLSVVGLKYPIKDKCYDRLWQGTLNESLGSEFTVLPSGKVIVYRVFNS